MQQEILIKNGKVVSSSWVKNADVLIKGDKIVSLAKGLKPTGDVKVIDAKGKYVLPGLIDAHTHYHLVSRGTVTCDGFHSGSKVAALSGVTTVVDFADHDKGKTPLESAKDRIQAMQQGMGVNFALHQGIYRVEDDIEQKLKELLKLNIRVLKIFTTYREAGYLIEDKEALKRLFKLAKKYGFLITAHCEDNKIIESTKESYTGPLTPTSHPILRPSVAEGKAITELAKMALNTDCSLYIVHLSSSSGLSAVRSARSKGARIIVETTPTYLFCTDKLLEGENGAKYIMTPPLRTQKDNKVLLSALVSGEVDVVATDHCAFTAEQKLAGKANSTTCLPGVPGTGEMFLSLYNKVPRNKLDIKKLVYLTSENPSRIMGLTGKGKIAPGMDADITIFDPAADFDVSENIVSASGYSLFEGEKWKGKFTSTIINGKIVNDNGVYTPTQGRFIGENNILWCC